MKDKVYKAANKDSSSGRTRIAGIGFEPAQPAHAPASGAHSVVNISQTDSPQQPAAMPPPPPVSNAAAAPSAASAPPPANAGSRFSSLPTAHAQSAAVQSDGAATHAQLPGPPASVPPRRSRFGEGPSAPPAATEPVGTGPVAALQDPSAAPAAVAAGIEVVGAKRARNDANAPKGFVHSAYDRVGGHDEAPSIVEPAAANRANDAPAPWMQKRIQAKQQQQGVRGFGGAGGAAASAAGGPLPADAIAKAVATAKEAAARIAAQRADQPDPTLQSSQHDSSRQLSGHHAARAALGPSHAPIHSVLPANGMHAQGYAANGNAGGSAGGSSAAKMTAEEARQVAQQAAARVAQLARGAGTAQDEWAWSKQ